MPQRPPRPGINIGAVITKALESAGLISRGYPALTCAQHRQRDWGEAGQSDRALPRCQVDDPSANKWAPIEMRTTTLLPFRWLTRHRSAALGQ